MSLTAFSPLTRGIAALLSWVWLAGAAVADPYCRPNAAEKAALPGESSLDAQEFLGPVLARAGILSDAVDLPQFQGVVPAMAGMVSRLRIYALSDKQMLMVMLLDEAAEPRRNGMRALLSYQR